MNRNRDLKRDSSHNLLWLLGYYSHSMSGERIARKNPSLSRSATGLNSEFSFSETSCHAKV